MARQVNTNYSMIFGAIFYGTKEIAGDLNSDPLPPDHFYDPK